MIAPTAGAAGARELAVAGGLAIAACVAVLHEWAGVLSTRIPDAAITGNVGWGADARLILYVLGWGARCLPRHWGGFFDAPVGYPAPGTLTGSEHFLGSQVLFAPTYALTGNDVLAANVCAFAAYPLTMLLMYAWARCLGVGALAAGAGSVVAAFAGLQADVDLHVLQYPAWCLIAVALALEPLRRSSGRRHVLVFAGVFLVAVLTSYQTAAAAVVVAAIVSTGMGIQHEWRPVRRVLVAVAACLAILAVVSLPYVARLHEQHQAAVSSRNMLLLNAMGRQWVLDQIDGWLVALSVAGAALAWRTGTERRAVLIGSAVAAVGYAFAMGSAVDVRGTVVWLPWKAVSLLPGSYAVHPFRFVALGTVGTALLIAVGLEAVQRSSLPGFVRRAAVGLGLAVVVWRAVSGVHMAPPGELPVGPAAPPARRWLAGQDAGAVLDLLPSPTSDAASADDPVSRADVMLGNLVHGRPVTTIHSHYVPAGSMLVRRIADRPPTPDVVQALVDLADVRWVLAPPASPEAAAWASLPWVRPLAAFPDAEVFAIDVVARRPWREALAAGPADDRSLLGSPLAPIAPPRPRIRLSGLPPSLPAGSDVAMTFDVGNEGEQPWPVALPPWMPRERAVRLLVQWKGPTQHQEEIALPWDVDRDDPVTLRTFVTTPPAAGTYLVLVGTTWGGEVTVDFSSAKVLRVTTGH